MQTSHKLTRIFFALMTLIVLAAGALAQADRYHSQRSESWFRVGVSLLHLGFPNQS